MYLATYHHCTRAVVRSNTDVERRGLSHSGLCGSSEKLVGGAGVMICHNENLFFMDLALCNEAVPCWKKGSSPNCRQEVAKGSMEGVQVLLTNVNGAFDTRDQQLVILSPIFPTLFMGNICSFCYRLAKDTEVSTAAPPDYRAASLPRLWDAWTHLLHSTSEMVVF